MMENRQDYKKINRALPLTAVLGGIVCVAILALGYYLGKNDSSFIPVSATASCETAGVVLATGAFNNDTEILYYIDSQAGQLTAGLLSRSEPGFVKTYRRNLKADLQQSIASTPGVSMPINPTFLMVTGDGDARRIGGEIGNPSEGFVYVAEVNTGIVLVYVVSIDGDRDLSVDWEELTLWTSARLNVGTRISSPQEISTPDETTPPVRGYFGTH